MKINPYVLLAIAVVVCAGAITVVSIATGQGPFASDVQTGSVPAPVVAAGDYNPPTLPSYGGGCGT